MKIKLLVAFNVAAFAMFAFSAAPYQGADFREIIATAKRQAQPAVLYVTCIVESTERGKLASKGVSGSAFTISADGEFVTNWHVVDKATSIRCLISDGRHFEADCIGSDKSMDLALCKLRLKEGETVPYATFGSSAELEEGAFVIALGAPWGLNRSLTFGTVSCAKRYIDGHSEYVLWIQTDASIGPGNSGGPLVNTAGEVVGINALGTMLRTANFGFAIPADDARVILDRLRTNGKVNWSWSGIRLQPLRDFQRDMYFDATNGVIVSGTDPDSPARQAGLLPSDRIVRLNGEPVTVMTDEDLPAVRRQFGLLPDADPITLDIVRAGEPATVVIEPRAKGAVEGEEREFPRWDFSAKAINQFETPDLFLRRQKGVFVFGVKSGGNASSNLEKNDIVLSVDGVSIVTLDDLAAVHKRALENIQTKHKALFIVLRNGRPRHVVIDFSKENE
ncbi:MAG: trypsin-like peptidase domain-containing protein [Kiritimatiellia bacterium]|jgi:serine protease Do